MITEVKGAAKAPNDNKDPKQIIFYGVPGSGKSFSVSETLIEYGRIPAPFAIKIFAISSLCSEVARGIRSGKFSTIISSKIFSYHFFLFFFWDPYNSHIGVFDIVPEVSETILSSFHSFYFILLFRSYFHHFIFQLTDSFFCFRYSAIDSF